MKFRKDKETVQAIINFGNEINVITSAYAAMLGLKIRFTAIGA